MALTILRSCPPNIHLAPVCSQALVPKAGPLTSALRRTSPEALLLLLLRNSTVPDGGFKLLLGVFGAP